MIVTSVDLFLEDTDAGFRIENLKKSLIGGYAIRIEDNKLADKPACKVVWHTIYVEERQLIDLHNELHKVLGDKK